MYKVIKTFENSTTEFYSVFKDGVGVGEFKAEYGFIWECDLMGTNMWAYKIRPTTDVPHEVLLAVRRREIQMTSQVSSADKYSIFRYIQYQRKERAIEGDLKLLLKEVKGYRTQNPDRDPCPWCDADLKGSNCPCGWGPE